MRIGINFGTTTTRGAYVNASGEAKQLPNAFCWKDIPPYARYHFEGVDVLSDEGGSGEMTRIVSGMRNIAEAVSCQTIDGAVLCVPAGVSFRAQLWDSRTEQRMKEAGIDSLDMLRESAAVAYAYTQEEVPVGGKALVYNLGGENFTAALVQRKKDQRFALLAEHTLIDCGGNALCERILEDAWRIIGEPCEAVGSSREQVWQQLSDRMDCMIRQLSRCGSTDIVYRNTFFEITEPYSQERLATVLEPVYRKTELAVERLLTETGLQKEDISQVFLAGSFSQLPYIREHLEQFLGKRPCILEDPEAAGAIGAAVYGTRYCMKEREEEKNVSDI